jgi:hypothetical protein
MGIDLLVSSDRRFVEELSLFDLIILSDHRVGLPCKPLRGCEYPLS